MESNSEEVLLETAYWTVVLAEDQTYPGRSVVVLKRPCGDLADLTTDELIDFIGVVKNLENALRKSFNATMFNWACLMNGAYQNDPPKPQVHWHFRPRYKNRVEFRGEVFEDADFGHHYARGTNRNLSFELIQNIADKIRENL